jgi:type IV secretory pathway VirJ component
MQAEWREAPSKRWTYAVGSLAIIASLTMFLVSRTVDSTANAATTLDPAPSEIAGAAQHRPAGVITLDAASVAAHAPASETITPPNLVVSTPPIEVTPVAKKMAPRTPTSRSTSMAHRSSTRKVPVAPRRATKIDPDGTIDPYR